MIIFYALTNLKRIDFSRGLLTSPVAKQV
uniref:Uncharacterized protein n=1 Tax=Rhizophora mucronata TaxID=61149 RepID=A0A2P2R183_RHIMU